MISFLASIGAPMSDHQDICGNPNCTTCRNNFRFDLPKEIPRALKDGRLALIAGAGISTEGRNIFPMTFYEEIARELGMSPSVSLSFPALMSQFCLRKGRRELLIRIKARFDYLASFPEVRRKASRFHEALSTIPRLNEIYTTNWDELFEAECGAVSFVTGEDYAFWDLPGRKVFKLHGSVSHYGSIIATEEDYVSCQERLSTGLIGSSLKLALATKTIVFAGYSIRDADFVQVFQLVKAEVGALAPPMYAVTLSEEDRPRLESLGLRVLVTDATYFVEELKRTLIGEEAMLDDSWLDDVVEILDLAREEHFEISERFNCVEYPALVYTLSYQDGLKHGLELLLAHARTGECSLPGYLHGKAKLYEKMRKDYKKRRLYSDVAYIEGYTNALLLPLLKREERFCVPLYYLLGSNDEINSIEEFASALPASKSLHLAAYKQAEGIVRRLGNDPDIVFHHAPWL